MTVRVQRSGLSLDLSLSGWRATLGDPTHVFCERLPLSLGLSPSYRLVNDHCSLICR